MAVTVAEDDMKAHPTRHSTRDSGIRPRRRGACSRPRGAALALLLTMALPAPAGAVEAEPAPAPWLESEVRVLTLRAADREPGALVRDESLAAIALAHSRAMYREQTLGHQLQEGIGPAERLARGHRRLFGLVAENVAVQKGWLQTADLAPSLVTGWMRSVGHRANILAAYDRFEVGCYGNHGAMYCTQLFVRSSTALAEPVAFEQPAGTRLSLRFADTGTPEGTRRITIGPVDAEPEGPGAAVEANRARLLLPEHPGLYRLRLWTLEDAETSRYRIVGGPYVRIIDPH